MISARFCLFEKEYGDYHAWLWYYFIWFSVREAEAEGQRRAISEGDRRLHGPGLWKPLVLLKSLYRY